MSTSKVEEEPSASELAYSQRRDATDREDVNYRLVVDSTPALVFSARPVCGRGRVSGDGHEGESVVNTLLPWHQGMMTRHVAVQIPPPSHSSPNCD